MSSIFFLTIKELKKEIKSMEKDIEIQLKLLEVYKSELNRRNLETMTAFTRLEGE